MEIDGTINEKPYQDKDQDQNDPDQKISNQADGDNKVNQDEISSDQEILKDQSELVQMLSQNWQKIYSNAKLRKTLRKILFVTIVISIVLFIFSCFIYIIPFLQEAGKGRKLKPANTVELKNDPAYKKQILQMKREAQKLSRKFIAYTPGQSYLVINTTDNKFFLYRNNKLVKEGFCSTGSYTRLTNSEGSRQWIFKTPKGRFWIQEKILSPLWIRPDWSFVEEGLPIPPSNDESRYEYGVLGDFAMSLGDGYLIHGTLYKRLLGMPVTHGCVRLDDEDLEAIYNTLNTGSKVYIF